MPLTLLDRLERRFRWLAIPNVTLPIIAFQAVLYVASYLPRGITLDRITLEPELVLQGEVWRLVTFLFVPPNTVPIFVIFYFLLLYTFGSGLEMHWGKFRYNLFLLTGYLANIIGAFIALAIVRHLPPVADAAAGLDAPLELGKVFDNTFFYGSLFLAFARVYPDFQLMIFFILPIRIKWLALLAWIGYFAALASGDWMTKLAVLATTANYLLFFGAGHLRQARNLRRRQEFYIKAKKSTATRNHTCAVCGAVSDGSRRQLFRYCTKCDGQRCYCPEHIQNHVHVTGEEPSGKPLDTFSDA